MTLPPLSLYVHLPWCVAKCPYCDFNSHAAGNDAPRARYVEALLLDLGVEAARANGRALQSIFMGGGTPSLFTPDEIATVLDAIRSHFSLVDDIEITMEANPGTVECGNPAGYREAGVNRLSLGAQSFSDASLKTLGRIHSAGDIRRAYDEARDAGFDNINLDLMYALPDQDEAAALADLAAAIALAPEHISWYQLTLERNTAFFARPPDGLPGHDLCFDIQTAGQAALHDAGFEQYEVSAYARDGRYCQHNLNYWRFGDYLAAGAGAHGKLTAAAGPSRYRKPANPTLYMQAMEAKPEKVAVTAISSADVPFEFALNALRLTHGFDERLYASATGRPIEEFVQTAQIGRARGLIERDAEGVWRATERGARFLDDLQASFLP